MDYSTLNANWLPNVTVIFPELKASAGLPCKAACHKQLSYPLTRCRRQKKFNDLSKRLHSERQACHHKTVDAAKPLLMLPGCEPPKDGGRSDGLCSASLAAASASYTLSRRRMSVIRQVLFLLRGLQCRAANLSAASAEQQGNKR